MNGWAKRIPAPILAVAVMATAVVPSGPSGAYERPGSTTRFGGCGASNCTTTQVSFSKNGRFAVLQRSPVGFLGVEPPQGQVDISQILIWDRKTGEHSIASVSDRGIPGAFPSYRPTISDDAGLVAFESLAPNLVTGDTNATYDIFVHKRKNQSIQRVSMLKGKEGNGPSRLASISGNGRYVAFESAATNLVAGGGDTNDMVDMFVKDLKTGKLERVSVSSGEQEAIGVAGSGSRCAMISSTGRYVYFQSTATNLVDDDTNALPDVFVRDRTKGVTKRVSVASDGSEATRGGSLFACPEHDGGWRTSDGITPDGDLVVFRSNATGLVPTKTNRADLVNATRDVYVHRLSTGRTERVSVTSTGGEVAASSGDPFPTIIDPSGRFVAFVSGSNVLAGGDTGGTPLPFNNFTLGDDDAFVYDLKMGSVEMISRDSQGREAADCSSTPYDGGLSGPMAFASSRLVVFHACSPNLASGDTDGIPNLFLRDRGVATGIGGFGSRPSASASMAGAPGFAKRGFVVITDAADDAGLGAVAEILSVSVAGRMWRDDLFVKIDLERMRRGLVEGIPAPDVDVIYGLRVTVGLTDYEVRIAGLGPSGGPAFGLFRCEKECVQVAELEGGYGTVGEAVVAAIPTDAVGLADGGEIKRVEAFSALGSYVAGPLQILDRASLPQR